jgi:hypothetical protein
VPIRIANTGGSTVPTGIGRKPTDADYGLGEHSFNADRLDLLDDSKMEKFAAEARDWAAAQVTAQPADR